MQLEGLPTWEAMDDSSDIIIMIKMINSLSHQTTDQKYHPLSLYMAKKRVFGLQQGPHMTNAQLVEKPKVRVEVIEEIGGAIEADTNLVKQKLAAYLKDIMVDSADVNTAHTTEAQRRALEQYLAVILLCAEDRVRADRRILKELKNDVLKGQSAFPATQAEALAMVTE